MRPFFKYIVLLSAFFVWSCGGAKQVATPIETLRAYHIAIRAKDTTMMKLLLSEGSLKLHQDEAKARGVTLDEIVQQQTLFPPDQRIFNYRDEKIEGNKATVEVENSFGGWDAVHLLKEGGAWKIDRKSTTEQIINDIEEQNKKLDEMIEKGREKTEQTPELTDDPTKNGDTVPVDPAGSPSPGPLPKAEDNQAIRKSPPPVVYDRR